jgi:hypothetical protein
VGVSAAALAAAAFALPVAHAQDQLVTGMVEATLGVSTTGAGSGTSMATVTRERRGDVTIITVIPR